MENYLLLTYEIERCNMLKYNLGHYNRQSVLRLFVFQMFHF